MSSAASRQVVFMVVPGSSGPRRAISPFMSAQMKSLCSEWAPCLGILDSRTSPGEVIRSVIRLRKELSQSKAVLVHALYGSMTALVACLIKSGRPLVISFCGDDLLGTPIAGWQWRLREKGARWLGLIAGMFASRIIVKSENLLDALPQALKRRAVVLPNGVDVKRFSPRDQERCRGQLGWPPRPAVVLFNPSSGTNTAVKNPGLARQAVEHARKTHRDLKFRSLSGLNPDEVCVAMNAADCLIVTSLHEGSPNVVKEAMACGLPVVSTPCGDVVTRLRNVTPGGVYPYDPEALGLAVSQVIRERRRSNGPECIRKQQLTLNDVAGKLAALYTAVCQQPFAAGLRNLDPTKA